MNSARINFDCDIYVIDSNAKLFSGDLVTYLGGRYVEFVIYPFSFKEYMECKRLAGNNASIQEEFEIYILMGRMPLFQITQLSRTLRGRGNRTRAALQGCSNPSSWTKPTSRKSSKSSTPQSSWCKSACANSTFPLII
ncbi:MAG: ATP-binding protein [Aeriscardovia sp.]|nr:ATP-binding protein [Aeriscardovia sp.]